MGMTLINRRLLKGAREVYRLALIILILAVLMVLTGCRQKHVEAIRQTTLGTFYVSHVGSTIEADFRTGYIEATNSNLGFEVHGIERDSEFLAQFDHVLKALAGGKLRLRVQLFSKNSASDFYCAEFQLGGAGGAHGPPNDPGVNYIYSGNLVNTYPLFFFTGIAPLGFYSNYKPKSTDQVTLRPRADSISEAGKLMPNRDYKVKLTVLEPIDITNPFVLVLYEYAH